MLFIIGFDLLIKIFQIMANKHSPFIHRLKGECLFLDYAFITIS